jgi:hypothetical protein
LLLLQESHAGDLMGHFGREKMLLMLPDHFYWPKMRRNVDTYVKRCITCNKFKSKLKPHSLYTPLPAPTTRWEDISMDQILLNSNQYKYHPHRHQPPRLILSLMYV